MIAAMTTLVLGLVLFPGIHPVRIVAIGVRPIAWHYGAAGTAFSHAGWINPASSSKRV